jgi:hypothetical protein
MRCVNPLSHAVRVMREDPPEIIRKSFPRTWYYPKWKLLAWFPRGILNEAFADQVFAFIEMEERIQHAPFDRYADLSGLTGIRTRVEHIFESARRRRKASQPVKSALFGDQPNIFSIAQMYEHLMDGAMIEVRVFDSRDAAARWLEVPETALESPALDADETSS